MSGHRVPKEGAVRYPFAPLAAAMGVGEAGAARLLGISGSTELHYRQHGMSEKVADRMAVKAGLVPALVWPEMVERAIRDVKDVDYKTAAERRERRRLLQARRREREDVRRLEGQNRQKYRDSLSDAAKAAQRAKARAYKAENAERVAQNNRAYRDVHRDRLNAQRRAYYRANREREIARQRAYDARKRASSSSDPQQADGMVT